jgi:hypothetical protein
MVRQHIVVKEEQNYSPHSCQKAEREREREKEKERERQTDSKRQKSSHSQDMAFKDTFPVTHSSS